MDLKTRLIHLRKTKNGESRDVPISDPLLQMFSKMDLGTKYVFINPITGTHHSRQSIQRLFAAFIKKYPQTKPWRLHSLRHSFAFNFLKQGRELYQLQAILGHKTISMTVDLYGQLRAKDIENPSPYNF